MIAVVEKWKLTGLLKDVPDDRWLYVAQTLEGAADWLMLGVKVKAISQDEASVMIPLVRRVILHTPFVNFDSLLKVYRNVMQEQNQVINENPNLLFADAQANRVMLAAEKYIKGF